MTAALFAYGLSAAAFLGFALHLALGWRGGLKASVLLAAVALSGAWAGVNFAFELTAAPAWWAVQAPLDALRAGAWLVFLALLLNDGRLSAKSAALLVVTPSEIE